MLVRMHQTQPIPTCMGPSGPNIYQFAPKGKSLGLLGLSHIAIEGEYRFIKDYQEESSH